ncbi:SH3 domain-containing protein [Saccharomonospora sp. NPDC046836]|uniref:SH3 domain-containing protein n=1 Tax=Saccharomonospora sp. NPDC046836 TaxID=3156921 RepID=UPI0033DECC92
MVLGIPKKTLIVVGVLAGVVVIYALGSDQSSSGAEGAGTAGCRVVVTADILNVRAEPRIGAEIVGKYQHNAESDASTVVQNGFRRLDENRWAAEEFLRPVDGANCG